MASIAELKRFSDVFKWESQGQAGRYSRETVTVAQTQSLTIGEIIGIRNVGAGAATYATTRTGDNTVGSIVRGFYVQLDPGS